MWADYYEKYRGTPKFGMSEQEKMDKEARLQDMKQVMMMSMLQQKLSSNESIQANKLDAVQNEGFASEKDIPKTMGDLDLDKVTIGKGNKLVPSYTKKATPSTEPLPTGFISVGGKPEKDPTFISPMDQRKIDADKELESFKNDSLKESAKSSLDAIEEAKKGAKYFGPMGQLPTIAAPSTLMGEYGPRQKWESNVNKLLSSKIIDTMAEMKRVSKTGATGFGQLSDREGQILREASTALKRNLLPEDALHYLNEMEKIHKKVLGMPTDEVNPIDGLTQATKQAVSGQSDALPPEIQALVAKGHKVVGVRNG